MNQTIESLLQRCTVKLNLPGGYGHGTGFFVAPGLILTCAHVVKGLKDDEQINVRWQDQENFAQATLEQNLPSLDIALLRFTLPDDANEATPLPCVYLDESVKSGDPLHLFGYPDDNPNGDPATFACEGLTGDASPFIKFDQGQVRPGMSGAPLLNQRTGKVCGMVKFTRNQSIDLGGGAIPTSVILEELDKLKKLQQEFHQRDRRWVNLIQTYNRPQLSTASLLSIIAAFALIAIRIIGFLQPFELFAYDWLMKLKPNDRVDERILIVGIKDSESDATEISDAKLQQILEKIISAQPAVIGLDIFRDKFHPNPEALENAQCDYRELVTFLESQTENIVTICHVQPDYDDRTSQGYSPASEQVSFGFSNIVKDQGDIVRRQLLRMLPEAAYSDYVECRTEDSLNFQLATKYFKTVENISEGTDLRNHIVFGQKMIEPFWFDTGGYRLKQKDDDGYQILLNYRKSPFDTLTVSEVLDGEDITEQAKGRVVLVGYLEDKSERPIDRHDTPVGKMPGVELQAHMTSHILSIVIEDKYGHPQLRSFAELPENLLVFLCCLVGGFLLWRSPSSNILIIFTGSGTVLLCLLAWSTFSFAGLWLPVIPMCLGIIVSPFLSLLLSLPNNAVLLQLQARYLK